MCISKSVNVKSGVTLLEGNYCLESSGTKLVMMD